MTEAASGPAQIRGYVVFREVEAGLWQQIGDVDHRPGWARGRSARRRCETPPAAPARETAFTPHYRATSGTWSGHD